MIAFGYFYDPETKIGEIIRVSDSRHTVVFTIEMTGCDIDNIYFLKSLRSQYTIKWEYRKPLPFIYKPDYSDL